MPKRSSRSSVHTWPDRATVDRAVREWAAREAAERPGVRRIGYLGSYARDEAGPGSDVDLVVLVERSDRPFIERAAEWDTTRLPVPADLMVYTVEEWARMLEEGRRFPMEAEREAVWVHPTE